MISTSQLNEMLAPSMKIAHGVDPSLSVSNVIDPHLYAFRDPKTRAWSVEMFYMISEVLCELSAGRPVYDALTPRGNNLVKVGVISSGFKYHKYAAEETCAMLAAECDLRHDPRFVINLEKDNGK